MLAIIKKPLAVAQCIGQIVKLTFSRRPAGLYRGIDEISFDILPTVYVSLTVVIIWLLEEVIESFGFTIWSVSLNWLRAVVALVADVSRVASIKETTLVRVGTYVTISWVLVRIFRPQRHKRGPLPFKGVVKALIYTNCGPLLIVWALVGIGYAITFPINLEQWELPERGGFWVVGILSLAGFGLIWFLHLNISVLSEAFGIVKTKAAAIVLFAAVLSAAVSVITLHFSVVDSRALVVEERLAFKILTELTTEEFKIYQESGEFEDHLEIIDYDGYKYRVVASRENFTIDATPARSHLLSFHVGKSGVIFAAYASGKAASNLDRPVLSIGL